MPLSLSDIKGIISDLDKKRLESLIELKEVSEAQLIQILKRTFKLDKPDSPVFLKTCIGKLLFLFDFAKRLKLKEIDSKKYDELILRLMSDNGEEAFNEIVCHFGLTQAFPNYGIYPLFSDAPDGRIGNNNDFVSVEIKSRFSQLLTKLEKFYSQISMIFPCSELMDLDCLFNIKRLDKKISDSHLADEIEYLKSIVSKGNYCDYREIRSVEYIEYEIEIKCSQTDGRPVVYLESDAVNNCIYLSNTAQYLGEGKASGKTKITVVLSEAVREVYSSAIIKDCLDRIKNIPDEPRCIVIYSNLLRDVYLNRFFVKVADDYVRKKKGTAIIGVFGRFLERTEEIGVGVNKIALGENIADFVNSNFRLPG